MNPLQFQKKILGMQEKMMNFALMLTMNRDDACDLLQDTMLKALSSREKFVDNVNFKGWVLTIMRNIFINNYHKVVRVQTVIDQNTDLYNLDGVTAPGVDTPDSAYQLKEVVEAIDSLNDELRIPLGLYLSGYKYSEIADKLQIPLGTIKSRIYFARKRLQEELKEFR